jgi:hypothetical protein
MIAQRVDIVQSVDKDELPPWLSGLVFRQGTRPESFACSNGVSLPREPDWCARGETISRETVVSCPHRRSSSVPN